VSGATPRPWKRNGTNISNNEAIAIAICLMGDMPGDSKGAQIDAACENAALIVRAVNAHDALVDVAAMALDFIIETPCPDHVTARSNAVKDALHAALSKGTK
jgi:hypothetical protein